MKKMFKNVINTSLVVLFLLVFQKHSYCQSYEDVNHLMQKEEYEQVVSILTQLIPEAKPQEKAWSYNILGKIFSIHGNYNIAEKYLNMALDNNKQDDRLKTQILINYAEMLNKSGNYSQSIKKSNQALKISTSLKNDSLKAKILNITGNTYYYLKQSDSAFSYYQQAQLIAINLNINDMLDLVNNNIAQIYYDRKDYTNAVIIYMAMLYNETVNPVNRSATLRSVALCYLGKKDYLEATKYIRQSMDLSAKHSDLMGLNKAYLLQGDLMTSLKNPYQAIEYIEKAYYYFSKGVYNNLAIDAGRTLINLYSDTKQYDKAIRLSNSILKNISEFTDNRTIRELKERITSIESDARLNEVLINMNYQKDKNKFQLIIIVFLLILFGLALSIGLTLYFSRKKISRNYNAMVRVQKSYEKAFDLIRESTKEIINSSSPENQQIKDNYIRAMSEISSTIEDLNNSISKIV
jgi:tetratricopeptide (TPR) repeat protein